MILVSSEAIPSLPLLLGEPIASAQRLNKTLPVRADQGAWTGRRTNGAVQASPVGMPSLAVFHLDQTSFERWSTLFNFRETREAGMSSTRAEFVHLLRGSRNATKVWCSEQLAESRTGSVDDATCAACLRTALDHYAVRHEESWLQIQRIMDRQVAIMEKAGW